MEPEEKKTVGCRVVGVLQITAWTLLVASTTCAQDAPASATTSPEWLIGSGADMQMSVRIVVQGPEGEPRPDATLQAVYYAAHVKEQLQVDFVNDAFSINVPVGRAEWFKLDLHAESADGTLVARQSVPLHDLREAARQGIELRLQSTERTLQVRVVDDGEPVPGSFVRAELQGGVSVLGRADRDGVATVPVMNADRLQYLTAWAEDFRFGGFAFHRDPPRDPAGEDFEVELDACRNQTIRLVDSATQKPLISQSFKLTIGTGPPDYQFPGPMPEDNVLTTDNNGEAVCRWFPDWQQHYCFVRINEANALDSHESELIDGVLVFSIRIADRTPRQAVRGVVRSDGGDAAGFHVRLDTFQGESERHMDFTYAFTQPNGSFTVECLPGSTYYAYVNDARYVTPILDGIPVPEDDGVKWQPQLDLQEGRPVQVVVVGGPDEQPIPFQQVQLSTDHEMTWMEEGEQQSGRGGRRWFVTTNRLGRTFTYALPDTEVTGAIYNPTWRMERSTKVKAEGITRLTFHRPYLEPRTIIGRIEAPEGQQANFDGLKVQAGAMDGETDWEAEIPVRSDGAFEIQTTATRYGLYARTSDGELAGLLVVGDGPQQVTLPLKPATNRVGRLVTPDQQPISNQKVNGVMDIRAGVDDFGALMSRSFRPTVQSATTDENGHFEISGIPGDEQLQITVRTGGQFGYDQRLYAREPQEPDVDAEYVIDPIELAGP